MIEGAISEPPPSCLSHGRRLCQCSGIPLAQQDRGLAQARLLPVGLMQKTVELVPDAVSFNRVGISLRRSGVARIRSSQNRFVLAERPQQARGRRCDRRRCEVAAIAWSEASQAFKVRRVDAATPATGTDRTSDHLNRIVKDYRIDLGAPLILKRIRDEMVPLRLAPIASQRPASFKPGHKKLGGRKKGTPFFSRALQ